MRNRNRLQALLVPLSLAVGCATVDPAKDYEQAEQYIRDATGADSAYRPGDDEAIRRQVEQLLADGLTADEAVQIALLNNPSLQAAFFRIGVGRAELAQAGLFSNPSLGASVRFPSGGGLVNIEAELVQNIVEIWQIPVRKEMARRNLHGTVLEIARAGAELALRTKSSYYDAVAAAQSVQVVGQNVQTAQEFLNLAVERQEAGASNQIEVNVARSEFLEQELALKRARLGSYESRRALALLLGLDVYAEELALTHVPPSARPSLSEDALLEAARQHRLDLRAAAQVVQSAEARYLLERRSIFGQVFGGVSAEREARPAGEDGQFVVGPTLELELPIFDQNQAQIAQAQFELEAAHRMHLAVDRALTQEVRGAARRAETAWEVDRFYRDELLPPRQENLDLAREAYRLGRTPFLSVLEAQESLLETRLAYNEVQRASAQAIVDLERATGVPVLRLLDAGSEETAAPGDAAADTERDEEGDGREM